MILWIDLLDIPDSAETCLIGNKVAQNYKNLKKNTLSSNLTLLVSEIYIYKLLFGQFKNPDKVF